MSLPASAEELRQRQAFYVQCMDVLTAARIPVLVGGAYAFNQYTGIFRDTKDFDLFIRREHVDAALGLLAREGLNTEITYTHWLAKAWGPYDWFIDLIYGSGNGVCPVDESWFEHAPQAEVLGRKIPLVPPEEMIWQKAFILERDRCDVADVAHVIRGCGESLDWPRLVRRFEDRWPVLLSQLILFSFIFPNDRKKVPMELLHMLVERFRAEAHLPGDDQLCGGTLLSKSQFESDLDHGGYRDARIEQSGGGMTPEEARAWTVLQK
ncbi:MAG: nucleotidyltransferase [Verrucomicrobiae bacterium]|nr:nucleotidyltransferase [Verrucomicrobiae bacterium]